MPANRPYTPGERARMDKEAKKRGDQAAAAVGMDELRKGSLADSAKAAVEARKKPSTKATPASGGMGGFAAAQKKKREDQAEALKDKK